jgi:hypothetical protein
LLKALTEWLADGAGLALGTGLHAGTRPATAPDLCTVVLERGLERVDPKDERNREKPVQLLTRGPSYFTARDEAQRIADFINTRQNRMGVTVIPGWFIKSIEPGSPQYLGQDDKGRHEFSTNVVVLARKEG